MFAWWKTLNGVQERIYVKKKNETTLVIISGS